MIALHERPRAGHAGGRSPVAGVSGRAAAVRAPARRRPAGRFVAYGSAPTHRPLRAQPAASSAPRTGLRLLAGGVVVAVVLIAVGLAVARGATPPAQSSGSEATTIVQVHAGENLTTVAARVAPDAPRAATVQRIVELNGLGGVAVRPGQSLVVPVSG